MNPLTGEILGLRNHIAIYPASHYVTSKENMERALVTIEDELDQRVRWFKDRGKLLEAQRIEQTIWKCSEKSAPARESKTIPVISMALRRAPDRIL